MNAIPAGCAPYSRYLAVAYCVAVVTALALGVATIDGLSPIDNHHFIAKTFQGKPFGWYVMPALGRFIPLSAQEYVLAANLFGPSPLLFHAINGLKIAACAAMLFHALWRIGARPLALATFWSVAILSIGFANASYRLQVSEINVFLLSLAALSLIVSRDDDDGIAGSWRGRIADAGAVLALAIACLYKEVAFVLPLVFGMAELVRKRRMARRGIGFRNAAMAGVGAAYVIGYLAWKQAVVTGSYAEIHSAGILPIALQFVRTDPFVMLVILPLAGWRFWQVIRRPDEHTSYDSMLAAAAAYALAFLALRIHNAYYLLPVYGFGVVGVAGLCLSAGRAFRGTVLAAAIGATALCLPHAISDLHAERAIARNHLPFVKDLAKWLWSNTVNSDAPRPVVLVGVSPGMGVEVIHSLRAFLAAYGVPPGAIEVQATEPADSASIAAHYGKSDPVWKVRKVGDVLVFNPYQQAPKRPAMRPSERSIASSAAEWSPPRWTLSDWVANCLVVPAECEARVDRASRFTGYAASVVIRDDSPVAKSVVGRPEYRVYSNQWPISLRAGERHRMRVSVGNRGEGTWRATGVAGPETGLVNMSYLWIDDRGTVVREGERFALPEPIRPGDEATLEMVVEAPARSGRFALVFSPVQEGVSWFYRGSGTGSQGEARHILVR